MLRLHPVAPAAGSRSDPSITREVAIHVRDAARDLPTKPEALTRQVDRFISTVHAG